MRYLKMAIMLGVLGFAGCGMGRDDTPPPEVNLDVSDIEIEIGDPFSPEGITGDPILELGE